MWSVYRIVTTLIRGTVRSKRITILCPVDAEECGGCRRSGVLPVKIVRSACVVPAFIEFILASLQSICQQNDTRAALDARVEA
jgi:hypothetical protein